MTTPKETRRIAQERMVEAISRHMAYLHRLSTGQANKAVAIVNRLGSDLARDVAERLEGLTPAELQAFAAGKYTTTRLKGLRSLINGWAEQLGKQLNEEVLTGLKDLADNETSYAHRLLQSVLENPIAAAPGAGVAYAAAMERPALGQLVTEMLDEIPERTRKQVYSRIRQGIAQGETNGQIVRGLRGTKALRYRDGIFQTTRIAAERVVRTGVNHVSNTAYAETWEATGVEEVVDVATLDGRTSKYCASVDGRRHKVGTAHPRPPYHPNCRTVQIPSLAADIMGERPYVRAFKPVSEIPKDRRSKDMIGQVSTKTRYPDWFSRQPASFQREWLGDTRYKLYKKGDYTIDRFVDPVGRQYSIAELEARDSETFKEVFGSMAA